MIPSKYKFKQAAVSCISNRYCRCMGRCMAWCMGEWLGDVKMMWWQCYKLTIKSVFQMCQNDVIHHQNHSFGRVNHFILLRQFEPFRVLQFLPHLIKSNSILLVEISRPDPPCLLFGFHPNFQHWDLMPIIFSLRAEQDVA